MRADLEIIQDWIPAGSRVLDLGCGRGELLAWLRDNKQVTGYGLEIDPENIAHCLDRGVNVIEQDLDKGLGNFASNSFDVVVMTQALQAVHYPDRILQEKEVFVLPDILGNAGGVTVSYFEWVQDTQNFQWSLEEINDRLHKALKSAFHRTLLRSQRDKLDMRTSALIEGIQRVAEAKLLRGLFP